jgi:hypothetical protein
MSAAKSTGVHVSKRRKDAACAAEYKTIRDRYERRAKVWKEEK